MIDGRWSWVWRAWCDLGSSRPMIGGGMGGLVTLPLPWGTIEDYGQRSGLGLGERMMLHQVLGALDAVQLKHDRAEAKAAAEATK